MPIDHQNGDVDTETNKISKETLNTGLFSSIILAILTIIAFGFAMIAIPPSGPNCPGNCMDYPYVDILTYFPRDYYWIITTLFQLCAFLFFTIAIHFTAPENKKIFSFSAVAFGLMSVLTLMSNYYLQFSVIPISLMKNQTEGMALLTQYNGHGIFIVLEELGFMLMSITFLLISAVFSGKTGLEKSIRWISIIPFFVCIAAYTLYAIQFGLDRDYRFEVAALTINWLVTIIVAPLIAIYFRRQMKIKKNGMNQQQIGG